MMQPQTAKSATSTPKTHRPVALSRLQAYGVNHVRAFAFSLNRLYKSPLASLLSILVIGFALALPGMLFILLDNARTLTNSWHHEASLSLFVEHSISDHELKTLADTLVQRHDIAQAQALTRSETLAEFRALSGFTQALDALEENPLPGVIVLTPSVEHQGPTALQALAEELAVHEGIARVVVDMLWLERLHAIMRLVQWGVEILTVLLIITVWLVIGNSIRLEIHHRRKEITLSKLIGASDAFVRRPFLYGGLWLGLLGALMALGIIACVLFLLHIPLSQLAALYEHPWPLQGPQWHDIAWLFSAGSLLGFSGAWITVAHYLHEIEPN